MTRQNGQEELHKQKVKTLNNDLTRSEQQKKTLKTKEAVFRRRRMLAFFVVAACIIAGLVSTNLTQKERLAAKEAYKLEAQQQLDVVTEAQEMLKLQITKLEDDEYIAKLARKEYFLSEEGEIIFTIPKEIEDVEDQKE